MNVETSASDAILLQLRQQLHGDKLDVPMLPEVAGKVVRLSQDPESDAGALARLIQQDQTLAAHVMRMANSALYSPSANMVSLQQAIARLGMRTITEIALAASINSSMFDAPGYEAYIQHILKRSLSAGLWAKEVARACRKNVEAAFLAGLLQDIGRPVVVHSALQQAVQLDVQLKNADIRLLEEALQHDVGVNVLQQWQMPQAVIQVVDYFDHYRDEHNGQLQTIIVVAGVTIAAHFADHGNDAQALQQLLDHPVFAEANLYPDEVSALLDRHELVKAATEALGL